MTLASLMVLVAILCGCSPLESTGTSAGQPAASAPATVAPSLASAPSAPSAADAVSRADEFVGQNASDVADLASKARPGHGKFAGLIVSWVAPNARLMDPESYSSVMVTIDGRIAQPPFVDTDTGLTTDGYTYGSEDAALEKFREYAVRLAEDSVGVDASGTPLAGVTPFISAYVIEYPWGYITMTPSYEFEQLGSSPNSPSLAFKPLSVAEQARLDSLDATQTASAWMRAPSYAQRFWLSSAKERLYLLKPNTVMGPQGTNAAVEFSVRLSGEDSSGYQADPQIKQVKYFDVEPTEQYGGVVIVGRPDSNSPWRVLDNGW